MEYFVIQSIHPLFQFDPRSDVELVQHQIGQLQCSRKVEIQHEFYRLAAALQRSIACIYHAQGTVSHQLHHAQAALALERNTFRPRPAVQIVPLECPAHCCCRFLKTQHQPLCNTNTEIVPPAEGFCHHVTQQFFLFAHFHTAEHQHFSARYGQTHTAATVSGASLAACHIGHAVTQPVCKCRHQLFLYAFSLDMNLTAAGIYNVKFSAGEHRARIPQLINDGKGKTHQTRCMCKRFDVMIYRGQLKHPTYIFSATLVIINLVFFLQKCNGTAQVICFAAQHPGIRHYDLFHPLVRKTFQHRLGFGIADIAKEKCIHQPCRSTAESRHGKLISVTPFLVRVNSLHQAFIRIA